MQQKAFVRINQSWLAERERVLLNSIAANLPSWVMPDHLTLLGLIGSSICGLGFALSGLSQATLWLAAVGLWLNWCGDSLDGSLARSRNTERPRYGFFVDHTSDIISQTLIFMGIALSPNVRFETGSLLLMSYWLAAMLTFIRTISTRIFQISYFGIGPTEIRLGLLVYMLSLPTLGPLPIHTQFGMLTLMDVLAIVIFAIVLTSFIAMSVYEARRLAALDQMSDQRSPRDKLRDLITNVQATGETTAS